MINILCAEYRNKPCVLISVPDGHTKAGGSSTTEAKSSKGNKPKVILTSELVDNVRKLSLLTNIEMRIFNFRKLRQNQ